MTIHNLHILQWNCRSLTRRIPELTHLLDELNINIAILCETRLDDKTHPTFLYHDLFISNRNRFGGGVAIMIRKDLRFTHINDDRIQNICHTNDIEMIFGKIWIEKDSHIFICSLYSPPRTGGNHLPTNPGAWDEILSYLSNFESIIIGGDINGKSTL